MAVGNDARNPNVPTANNVMHSAIVVVSDGSTDETLELVRAASEADQRIVVAGDGAKIGKAAAFVRCLRC